MHVHTTWTLLLIDAGTVHYRLGGRSHVATPQDVTLLPPGLAHNGHGVAGFTKRVIYLERGVLGDDMIEPALAHPRQTDPYLRHLVDRLYDGLVGPCPLEYRTSLGNVAQALRGSLRFLTQFSGRDSSRAAIVDGAELLRQRLDADLPRRESLDEHAAALGWSSRHLARGFTQRFGLPPHRYLLSRRLEIARARLLAGERTSDVAVDVGFHDQAHLTRHFRRQYGTTPGSLLRGRCP